MAYVILIVDDIENHTMIISLFALGGFFIEFNYSKYFIKINRIVNKL